MPNYRHFEANVIDPEQIPKKLWVEIKLCGRKSLRTIQNCHEMYLVLLHNFYGAKTKNQYSLAF